MPFFVGSNMIVTVMALNEVNQPYGETVDRRGTPSYGVIDAPRVNVSNAIG